MATCRGYMYVDCMFGGCCIAYIGYSHWPALGVVLKLCKVKCHQRPFSYSTTSW